MADYKFEAVETCSACGTKTPKEQTVMFNLNIAQGKVKRFMCARCFGWHVLPFLLTEEEKRSMGAGPLSMGRTPPNKGNN